MNVNFSKGSLARLSLFEGYQFRKYLKTNDLDQKVFTTKSSDPRPIFAVVAGEAKSI